MLSDELSDNEIESLFARLRWPPSGEPRCPHCGAGDPYELAEYRRNRCSNRGCRGDYTLLSGTVFHSTKLSLRTLLRIVEAYCAGSGYWTRSKRDARARP